MNLLAIETSTPFCSVAARGGKSSFAHFEAGQRHAELVLEAVRKVMAEAELGFDDLDGIAYGMGPGSFTGLRIACGVTQGLALSHGLGVVGVVSLEAMAEQVRQSGAVAVIACLDARMGEVYHAAYRKSERGRAEEASGWQVVSPPGLYAPDAVPKLPGRGWTACGSGFTAHGGTLRARYEGQLDEVISDCLPMAGAILDLAEPVFAAGRAGDAAQALPLYLRDKVALTKAEQP